MTPNSTSPWAPSSCRYFAVPPKTGPPASTEVALLVVVVR